MDQKSLHELMHNLEQIFDVVRLVDVSRTILYTANADGKLVDSPYVCYSTWNRNERCENCISAKSLLQRTSMTKFEFIDNDVYYVYAKPIELDGTLLVIEIVSTITDQVLFGAYGKSDIIKTIQAFNKKLYRDELTDAYNRQYFMEQLQSIRVAAGIAMLDVDNLKFINDTYGHSAGDDALKAIIDCVKKNVRESDYVIRYGGDEFLIILPEISKASFKLKLKELLRKILQLSVESIPDETLSVSIGGYFSNEEWICGIDKADKLMYQAKIKKSCVCC